MVNNSTNTNIPKTSIHTIAKRERERERERGLKKTYNTYNFPLLKRYRNWV
jgi:hypothetical protein